MEGNSVKQITLRISDKLYEETKKEADEIGSSYNSFLLTLIALGRKVYNCDEIILRKDQSAR